MCSAGPDRIGVTGRDRRIIDQGGMFLISRPLLSATFIIASAVTGASILLSAYGGVPQSAGQPAREPAIRYVPDDVQDSSWLKRVAADQVKATAGVSAFHNFQ